MDGLRDVYTHIDSKALVLDVIHILKPFCAQV